jgi:hypothetical protein
VSVAVTAHHMRGRVSVANLCSLVCLSSWQCVQLFSRMRVKHLMRASQNDMHFTGVRMEPVQRTVEDAAIATPTPRVLTLKDTGKLILCAGAGARVPPVLANKFRCCL